MPLLFNVIAIYRRLLLQSERAGKSAVQLKILNVFGRVRFCSAIYFIIFADTLSRGIGVLERYILYSSGSVAFIALVHKNVTDSEGEYKGAVL